MNNLTFNRRALMVIIYFVVLNVIGYSIGELVSTMNIDMVYGLALTNLIPQVINLFFLVTLAFKDLIRDFYKAKLQDSFWITCLKYLGLIFLSNFITSLIINSFINQSDPLNQTIINLLIQRHVMIMFVVTVILAPIIEELVFRYAMIDLENPRVTLFVSSLMFGLIHILNALLLGQFNELWYLLVYGVLGFILGLSYVKTKNIWVPIFIHALYNGISFFILVSQV